MPATTNNLTKAIINFLLYKGHFAFRVNNGAVYDPVKKVFRRSGKDDPAISDIICTLNPNGVTLYVEVKNSATKDSIKKEQKEFADQVTKRGALHHFAKDYSSFLAWYFNDENCHVQP